MERRMHSLTINVTFDKPCSVAWASECVGDNIHGEYYPAQFEDHHPGVFRVRSISRQRRKPGR